MIEIKPTDSGRISQPPYPLSVRLAYFLAEDTFGHIGSLVRSLVYLITYYTFAQPRAAAAQMYLVTVAIVYCCTGTAYFLSQVRMSLTRGVRWWVGGEGWGGFGGRILPIMDYTPVSGPQILARICSSNNI